MLLLTALSMSLLACCVLFFTVFVNCLVKEFAMFFGVAKRLRSSLTLVIIILQTNILT